MVQEAGFYSKIENIPASFTRSVWHPTGDSYNYYRPVSTSVYILGAWASTLISGDILPWIFHLTNILLQIVFVSLLFTLFTQLALPSSLAFWCSLAFFLNPVSAATVAWIPGQNELLLACSMVAGFIFFLKALERPRYWIGYGLCLFLGLLIKENAVALILLAACYLVLKQDRWKNWGFASATWAVTLAFWFFLVRYGANGEPPAAENALLSLWHGLPFLLIYLGKWIFPVGLTTLPTAQDTAFYTWIAGGLAAVLLVVITLRSFKFNPIGTLGIAWFVGFLWPTLANLPLDSKMTFILREDRSYLASVGLILVFSQIQFKKAYRNFLAAFALLWLILNLKHQFDYKSGMNFYSSGVKGSPKSAFAHTHLGDMYLAEKDFVNAISQYKEAISLNPYEPQANNNLGVAYQRVGDNTNAMEHYKRELSFNPKNLLTWSNLGFIYLSRGDHENAEISFRKAVEINSSYRDAWTGLYRIYEFRRDYQKRDEAFRQLQKAEMDMSRGI